MPTFAFHDLHYIPSGFSGILAPYIETGPGTMRAAATLMGLDTQPIPLPLPLPLLLPILSLPLVQPLPLPPTFIKPPPPVVVCDLGCGDGAFLINLITHINLTSRLSIRGVGIDYDATLLTTAATSALLAHQSVHWITYDFNLDLSDLSSQLLSRGVTHVFVYLVPKQLNLKTVRGILERLVESGVVVCCHKFQPRYLVESRRDRLMDLVIYEKVLS